VVNIYNPSTLGAKAGGSQDPGQAGPCSDVSTRHKRLFLRDGISVTWENSEVKGNLRLLANY
jgi:hypothetical protein